MLALVIVLVSGWFLASAIGTLAYFVGKSEANIVPFENMKSETYQFLREQRALKLKAGSKIRVSGQMNGAY
jgi:hypothetical protein